MTKNDIKWIKKQTNKISNNLVEILDDEMDWAGRLTQVMAMMVNQLQYHDINEFKVEKIDD